MPRSIRTRKCYTTLEKFYIGIKLNLHRSLKRYSKLSKMFTPQHCKHLKLYRLLIEKESLIMHKDFVKKVLFKSPIIPFFTLTYKHQTDLNMLKYIFKNRLRNTMIHNFFFIILNISHLSEYTRTSTLNLIFDNC